ncbi:UspA domain-containing protein [Rhodomicrobium vannielii ATCC 17100]|uniref:UspA domain-containing protein n=1 Tax=Rhodomicrobium vannielii (strain ATCC 17100 / DSM 162 / LMG 4299 / NCIMB 10020 / ATH 3.1.1) TaxID=648757 RepID=E3I3M0_RHOVT|nr:universal stress protein [Rhodomicrobium vannielii]ADP70367.1 UspA domain-containing protein [Rhodomicrobium vannielii ATCC 17100]
MKGFKKILCVADQEKGSDTALQRAVKLAENNKASLTVVDVMPRSGRVLQDVLATMVDEREKRLARLIQPHRDGLDIETKLLKGIAFLEVIREVLRSRHDLVIKCHNSPGWVDRLLSSEDISLLRECPCPVWLIKPDEASSAAKRILAAVDVDDDYPSSELATRHALNVRVMELAVSLALSEAAELQVVHAWQVAEESSLRDSNLLKTPEGQVDDFVEHIRERHARLLDTFLKGFDANPALHLTVHTPKGAASKEIPELAERLRIDCIVMGTVARTGIRGFIMGNTAESVLEQVDCSVLAIKPPGFETPVALEN